MNTAKPRRWADFVAFAARWAAGAAFVYFGLSKALNPADFLRLLREYQLVSQPLLLNSLAVVVPWLELGCGVLLCLGVAVRGSALVCVTLLVAFTAVVLRRALAMQTGEIAFCSIRFDCGCGGGEVLICRKLIENVSLTAACVVPLVSRSTFGALRHRVV